MFRQAILLSMQEGR